MAYDKKCLDLAEHFLPRTITPSIKSGLAQVIQDAAEEYILGKIILIDAALKTEAHEPSANIFSRPECVFKYCPFPGNCKEQCNSTKEVSDGLEAARAIKPRRRAVSGKPAEAGE